MQRKKLPENFAENVLELEMQVDQGGFNITTVDGLIYLYSVSELISSKALSTLKE